MSEGELARINMVQSICMRPRMYTLNGPLQEVYDLLSGNAGPPIGGTLESRSVVCALEWIHLETSGSRDVVASMLERFGNEDAALNAIADFAAGLLAE